MFGTLSVLLFATSSLSSVAPELPKTLMQRQTCIIVISPDGGRELVCHDRGEPPIVIAGDTSDGDE